jgi:hypothetical protein
MFDIKIKYRYSCVLNSIRRRERMSDYDFGPALKAAAGICIAGGIAIGVGIWGATSLFNYATAEEPLFALSKGRQQLLDEGFVGNRRELQSYLAQQANRYFEQKGYPCDPVKANARVFETAQKARCAHVAPASN